MKTEITQTLVDEATKIIWEVCCEVLCNAYDIDVEDAYCILEQLMGNKETNIKFGKRGLTYYE